MTELGAKSEVAIATRNLASALGGLSILIVFVWLLRGPLQLSPYSLYLLIAALGFSFLSGVFRTKTKDGPIRAAASFFFHVFGFALFAIILILFLGWVASLQGGGFPQQINMQLPDIVIAMLASVALGLVLYRVAPPLRTIRPTGKHLIVNSGASLRLGAARLSALSDGVAIPMSLSKNSSGHVLFSDISASIETPMGTKEIKLKSPLVVKGLSFTAKKASEEDVRKLTGRSSKDLVADSESTIKEGAEWGVTQGTSTDAAAFVQVQEDSDGSDIEVGPISVRRDNTGEYVRVGSFRKNRYDRYNWDWRRRKHEENSEDDWFAYTKTGSNIICRNGAISGRWNGSSMSLRGNHMQFTLGGDGFEYDPHEVKTTSPLHTLRITQNAVFLETAKFSANVYASRVLVRTFEGKTRSTDSVLLANDLRQALTELAMKQVKDLISGEPIDLEEMLGRTEGVLTRYA